MKINYKTKNLIFFAGIFAVIGAIIIWRSFAVTPTTANLWVDSSGGTCARQATAGAYSDAAACSSLDAAWDTAQAGDIIIVKAGTYSAQIVNGDKTSETKIIGENGTRIAGVTQCADAFGSDGAFCANARFMTLENVTIDALANQNVSSGSQINAANVTYHNVNIIGDYVSLAIDGADFTWQGGSHGQDGIDGKRRTCEFSAGEPIWVWAPNATIDGIRFNPKKIQSGGVNNYCGADVTPHLESIRLEDAADNFTLKNTYFVPGTDAGSGHIFSSADVDNLTLVNNYFGEVNAFYWIQANNGGNSNWTMLYNTFTQGGSMTASSQTWVGNLGAGQGCDGTHSKNVWSGSGSCGTDTFVGSTSLGIGTDGRLASSSPAINAAETTYCTGSLVGARDFEGTIRPQGAACDAGADEYGATTTPPPTCTFTGPKAGEIDGVSPVSAHDLSLLLSHFNQTNNSYPAGDFDSDCSITAHDLSMLLANWGK